MNCPLCNAPMRTIRADETFAYDTGRTKVRCQADDVPVLACVRCRETASGPEAEAKRSRAVVLALQAELHRVMDELERAYRKQMHGCTDASCPLCDGDNDG